MRPEAHAFLIFLNIIMLLAYGSAVIITLALYAFCYGGALFWTSVYKIADKKKENK